jgi:hypothetical protein
MCNVRTVSQEVAKVIRDFVGADRMFTAFDITKKLRSDTPAKRIFHSDVRGEIRTMFDDSRTEPEHILSDYERRLCWVTSDAESFVYYPPGQDPDNYSANGDSQTVATVAAAIVSRDNDKEDNDDDVTDSSSGKVLHVTQEKRLTIPQSRLEDIQVDLKGTCFCYADGNDLIVTPYQPDVSGCRSLTLNGRLRLPSSLLKTVFSDLDKGFSVRQEPQTQLSMSFNVLRISAAGATNSGN